MAVLFKEEGDADKWCILIMEKSENMGKQKLEHKTHL